MHSKFICSSKFVMDNYYYWFIDLGQIEKNHAGMEYELVEL